MTSRDFCYWAQGFFEISEVSNKNVTLNSNQVELIERHLAMVFEFENHVEQKVIENKETKLPNIFQSRHNLYANHGTRSCLKNKELSSHDFCIWLQGIFDILETKTLNAKQVAIIREKLNSVFIHEIDPSFGTHKEVLQNIHNPKELEASFPINSRESWQTVTVKPPTTSYSTLFTHSNSNQSPSFTNLSIPDVRPTIFPYDVHTVRLMC